MIIYTIFKGLIMYFKRSLRIKDLKIYISELKMTRFLEFQISQIEKPYSRF